MFSILKPLMMQLLTNPEFQKSIIGLLTGLGGVIRQNANNPQNIMKIADDLEQNPDLIMAAAVKNTDAAHLVDVASLNRVDEHLA